MLIIWFFLNLFIYLPKNDSEAKKEKVGSKRTNFFNIYLSEVIRKLIQDHPMASGAALERD
jgi:hypothetical protein